MAKRGRRSIRNKRKSVKKYSSKRRSKTRRYLRGGVVIHAERGSSVYDPDMTDPYMTPGSSDYDPDMTDSIRKGLRTAADNYAKEMTLEDIKFMKCKDDCYNTDDEDMCVENCIKLYPSSAAKQKGGGRRRYHRKKQSKTRKH